MIPAHENPVSEEAVRLAVSGVGLKRWQQHLLSKFPRESFKPVPEYARYMSSLWRFATWEHLVSDTIACNGTQMPTILSMVYKPDIVAEFGVDGGLTTMLLCKLNQDARVYAVDKFSKKRDADVPICFQALMHGVDNLTLVVQSSSTFVQHGVQLCFIDGEHCGEAPYLDSWRAWYNRDPEHFCIAWDDYHETNPDVKSAVDRFCKEVDMPLNQLGSWFYIGTEPHSKVEALQCQQAT